MPCLLGCLALFVPRLVIVLLLIFTHYLESAYQTFLWPLLGFLFMPLTTLAYALAINSAGSLTGFYLFLFVVAVLADLGVIGSGGSSRRWVGAAAVIKKLQVPPAPFKICVMKIKGALVLLLSMGLPAMAEKPGSPEFSRVVPAEARLEKLATGMHFIEGPVWMPGNYLVFSDIPANELKRWDGGKLSTFRRPSHQTNGNTIDRQGRLISCEHAARRVTRTEADGSVVVLADSYEGKPLNSPNDVVVQSDGTIWFTDPPYGIPRGQRREQAHNYVFALNPETKQLHAVVADFDRPNGLCFSPDEKKLYIADSGKSHHIRVFDVTPDHRLTNGRVFAVIDKGVPDGIRCDKEGNIFSSAGDGVQVFAPDGRLLGRISVPEVPANLCFGGGDGHTLFITARTSLYAISTRTSAP